MKMDKNCPTMPGVRFLRRQIGEFYVLPTRTYASFLTPTFSYRLHWVSWTQGPGRDFRDVTKP